MSIKFNKCWDKKLGDNTHFEFQIANFGLCWNFDINLSWFTKTDHAGPKFYINICGFMMTTCVYDTRHWDDDNDCWKKYD